MCINFQHNLAFLMTLTLIQFFYAQIINSDNIEKLQMNININNILIINILNYFFRNAEAFNASSIYSVHLSPFLYFFSCVENDGTVVDKK